MSTTAASGDGEVVRQPHHELAPGAGQRRVAGVVRLRVAEVGIEQVVHAGGELEALDPDVAGAHQQVHQRRGLQRPDHRVAVSAYAQREPVRPAFRYASWLVAGSTV